MDKIEHLEWLKQYLDDSVKAQIFAIRTPKEATIGAINCIASHSAVSDIIEFMIKDEKGKLRNNS